MKKISMLLCLCLVFLAAFGFSLAAYAGGETGGASAFILPDKSAPGQQWQGTITIYYTKTDMLDTTLGLVPDDGTAWWFMRIEKGSSIYAFDGSIEGGANPHDPPYYCQYCSPQYNANSIQYKLLNESIDYQAVLDALGYDGTAATCALQNYSNLVQAPDGSFVTFDFVIAVQK